MKRMSCFVLVAAVVLMTACDSDTTLSPTATALLSSGESDQGVHPIEESGNMSGGAVGVCTYVDTEEEGWLVGGKWEDPLAGESLESAGFTFHVSPDGKYLDWLSNAGNIMKAIVVKGGSAYHVYYYNPPVLDSDMSLHSPIVGQDNVPEISWFAFCYELGSTGAEGCAQGFWRANANNWGASQWPTGYDPTDLVTDHFAVPVSFTSISGATLLDALGWTGGGPSDEAKAKRLLRQAVAALLSAAHPEVDYPRTEAEIVDDVNEALAGSGDMEDLKDELDSDNNLGCPLSQKGG